jgi:hypothetical protein
VEGRWEPASLAAARAADPSLQQGSADPRFRARSAQANRSLIAMVISGAAARAADQGALRLALRAQRRAS